MGGRICTFIFGLGLLALLSGCGEEKAEPKQHSRVFVQTVQPADFAAAVTLTGDIQARVQTDLSFRVGGKIIQRMVDVGDRVSAKQVLAKLDPKDLQTNVDSAQAQIVAEQARVKQTAAAFVRQEKLLPKGYTSRSEYDSAQAALRSSQSALAAAQAAAAPGTQHRVADYRQVRMRLEQFDHGVDHFQRAEHAQLDGGNPGVTGYGIGLGHPPPACAPHDIADVDRVLHGQCGDGRGRMTTLGEQGFDICLQAGATTGIMAGETEDNGARAVDIHGARAYHQTLFGWLSGDA